MKKNKGIILSAMGLELVGIILGCAYLGKLLDDTYQLKGLGIVGMSVLGLVGWLIHIIQILKVLENEENTDL